MSYFNLLSPKGVISFRLAILLLVISVPVSVPSFAQLDEIVVTAQKRSENVQDVPIAINTLSGDQFDDFGIKDTDDVIGLYSNLSLNQRSGVNSGVAIRGVGTDSFHISSQQSVGLYVDDVTSVSPFVSQLSVFDMDRVEVLRGPQNTLYGRNTTGGAVNFITRKPQIGQAANGYTRFEVGNGDLYGFEGAFETPLSDKVALRIAGVYEDFGGLYTNLADGSDYGGSETYGIRMHLAFEASERLSGVLTFSSAEKEATASPSRNLGNLNADGTAGTGACNDAINGESDAFAKTNCFVRISASQLNNSPGLLAAYNADTGMVIDNPDQTNAGTYLVNYSTNDVSDVWAVPGVSSSSDTSFDNYVLNLVYEMDDMTLTSITSYLETGIYALNTYDLHSFLSGQEGYFETFSQELRLTSDSDGALNWLVGLYYVDEESEQDTMVIRTDRAASPSIILDATLESTSAYGQLDYDATDKLSLTFGLRYSEETIEADFRKHICTGATNLYNFRFNRDYREAGNCSHPPPLASFGGFTAPLGTQGVPANMQNLIPHPKQDLEEWAFKIGADYQVTDDVMTYASFSTGYKGGAFDNRALGNGDNPIGPEYIDAIEAGFKSDILEGRLQINGAIFFYIWEDQQLFEVAPDGTPALINIDETEVQGIDIEVKWAPTDNLFVMGSAGFLDTEITENANALRANANTQAKLGNEITNAPDMTGNLMVNYTTPLGNGELSIQPSMRYIGEKYFQLSNAPRSKSDTHTVFNFRIGYNFGMDGKYEFAVLAKNLFEEERAGHILDGPGIRAWYISDAERSIVASLSANF